MPVLERRRRPTGHATGATPTTTGVKWVKMLKLPELVQLLKTIKLAITMKLDKTHKVAEFADPLKVIHLA